MTWEVPSHTSTFHRLKAAPAGSTGWAVDDVHGQGPSTPSLGQAEAKTPYDFKDWMTEAVKTTGLVPLSYRRAHVQFGPCRRAPPADDAMWQSGSGRICNKVCCNDTV